MIPDGDTQKVVAAMAAAAPDPWSKIELTVSAVASLIRTGLVVELADGSINESTTIDPGAQLSIGDLRDSMYKDGVGTWYNAKMVLTRDGQLETDFDYENPPFDGDYEPEILEDDQETYPRSQENLPTWHPSRK